MTVQRVSKGRPDGGQFAPFRVADMPAVDIDTGSAYDDDLEDAAAVGLSGMVYASHEAETSADGIGGGEQRDAPTSNALPPPNKKEVAVIAGAATASSATFGAAVGGGIGVAAMGGAIAVPAALGAAAAGAVGGVTVLALRGAGVPIEKMPLVALHGAVKVADAVSALRRNGGTILKKPDMSKAVPRNARRRLYDKQQGMCPGCGNSYHKKDFTLDHIHPRSRGGRNAMSNLQLLCSSCNSIKGNRTMQYLLERNGRA